MRVNETGGREMGRKPKSKAKPKPKRMTKMEQFKSWVVEHHKTTLIGLALRDTTPEEWENIAETALKKAKDASDVVAILMRGAFAYLCWVFFSSAAVKADHWLPSYALGLSGFLSFVMFAVIMIRFMRIVGVYYASDSAHWNNKLAKVFLLISSIIITFAVTFGITSLVKALVQTSNLLK